jgi:hypothetical protein
MEANKVKEVKEALEICSNEMVSDCDGCPYDGDRRCVTKLKRDALEVIKALMREKEDGNA